MVCFQGSQGNGLALLLGHAIPGHRELLFLRRNLVLSDCTYWCQNREATEHFTEQQVNLRPIDWVWVPGSGQDGPRSRDWYGGTRID